MKQSLERGQHVSEADALRDAHQLLLAVVDNSPIAIIGLDLARRVTTWNDAATRLYGYSSEDVVGEIYPDAPTDAVIFAGLFEQVRDGRIIRGVEIERVGKDGSRAEIRYSAAPLCDPSGSVRGVVTLSEDIGAATALRGQEARLRTVLETVPDAIIVIDETAAIQSFSAAAERQFGYRADEVIGRNVNILMPSPYRDKMTNMCIAISGRTNVGLSA